MLLNKKTSSGKGNHKEIVKTSRFYHEAFEELVV